MTTNLKKIPATIVTGFLGSGKTTLLSNILRQAKGKRIAVIVNEFGELDIDADLLRNCPLDCDDETEVPSVGENGIYELANGCICCTVEEEFLPVMQELVKRRDDIDHILIETSGLALPKPLVQAFNWPEIKQHCTVDAVITLIDGPAVAAGRFASNPELVQAQREADEGLDHDPSLQELLDDQLSAADLVIVSKNDLLDDEQIQKVESILKTKLNDSVKVAYLEQGDAPLDVLMGLDAKTEDHIKDVHNHHDHHHAHGAHHEHAHDHFDSFVLSTDSTIDMEVLSARINVLVAQYNIFRIKGFVNTGKPMRQIIQVVGKRIDIYFDRPWEENEAKTQLVFIGKDLDQTKIEAFINS